MKILLPSSPVGKTLYQMFLPLYVKRPSKLEMPTTLDEFVEMLRYYKSHDMNGNCDCNYIPRLWLDYEVSDIASLIAPRPLVIQSARGDHLNGPRGLDNVLPYVEELKEAYRLLGAEGKLYHDIIEGPHHFGHEHLKEDFEKIGMEI